MSKIHFNGGSGALCGRETKELTVIYSNVTCYSCQTKIPQWEAEQKRIELYNAEHDIIITLRAPLSEWKSIEAAMKRSIEIAGILGGMSKFQLDLYRIVASGNRMIVNKKEQSQ